MPHSGLGDRELRVKVGCLVAYGLWVLAVTLLCFAMCQESWMLAVWGLATTGGAATATIRMYFVAQNQMMRRAFEYGREQGRADIHAVRPVRA